MGEDGHGKAADEMDWQWGLPPHHYQSLPIRHGRAKNIFDDLLLQPHSGTDAYKKGSQILCQAIQMNL